MNGFVRPRLKRHERVEFLDKLTRMGKIQIQVYQHLFPSQSALALFQAGAFDWRGVRCAFPVHFEVVYKLYERVGLQRCQR